MAFFAEFTFSVSVTSITIILTAFLFRRFQCGDGGVQEHQLYCVGRGRSGQDPAPVEALLPEYPRTYFRCGQQRQVPWTSHQCTRSVRFFKDPGPYPDLTIRIWIQILRIS